MPRVIGKVEGRGNGIKTVIFNVMDLSLALKRDPGEVCKFFGTELGAQVNKAPGLVTAGVAAVHPIRVLFVGGGLGGGAGVGVGALVCFLDHLGTQEDPLFIDPVRVTMIVVPIM